MNAAWAQAALLPVVGVALLVSVVTDFLSRRVLDRVTYPAAAACLALRFAGGGLGGTESGLTSGLIGAAGLGGVFAYFAWRERMGWGDVKLTAVVGAGLGYPRVLAAAAFISLAGALQAVVLLLWRGELGETLGGMTHRTLQRLGRRSVPGTPVRDISPGRGVPYAIAIALGTLWTFWWESSTLG